MSEDLIKSNPQDNVPSKEQVQKKLESLTPEQEAMIPEFREKWLNRFYNNTGIDKKAATREIEWLYNFCGKEKPKVFFQESPIACQMLIQNLKDGKDENTLIDISKHKEVLTKDFYPSSYYANTSDYGWVAFYDFFQSLDFFDYDWTNFNHFKDLLISGIYELYTFENVCIACSIPKVKQDDQNRLHCEDGYAVVFPDGFSMCYWHGVNVIERWIFDPTSITKEEIIEEKNAEKRRIMKEILGSKEFATRLGITCIDEDVDPQGNAVKLYKSTDKDEAIDDYLYFANVTCPSTGREYFISVPGTKNNGELMANCWDAVAWTFKMNKEEYKPTIET